MRALAILLSLAFLGTGGWRLWDTEQAAVQFAHFGYGARFVVLIGVCEVAGAIGLQVPRLAALAALGLACIMVGAVVSHLAHDPVASAVPPALLCALLVFVAQARWDELTGEPGPD